MNSLTTKKQYRVLGQQVTLSSDEISEENAQKVVELVNQTAADLKGSTSAKISDLDLAVLVALRLGANQISNHNSLEAGLAALEEQLKQAIEGHELTQ